MANTWKKPERPQESNRHQEQSEDDMMPHHHYPYIGAIDHRHVLGFDAPELAMVPPPIYEHLVEEKLTTRFHRQQCGCIVANRHLIDLNAASGGFGNLDIGVNCMNIVELALTESRHRTCNIEQTHHNTQ